MRRAAGLLLIAGLVAGQTPGDWYVAKNSHFEVYSEAGPEQAARALGWFEQLRAFFEQNGLLGAAFTDQGQPVRVVGFRSQNEYDEFRVRPFSDAYYASDGTRDYIVVSTLQPRAFNIAAHEYVHHVLHSSHLDLPAAINEGLAEFFSTLRLKENGYELGGDLPARTQALQRNRWLPLRELLHTKTSPEFDTRQTAGVFYSESWALVDMLMTSPKYAGRLPALVAVFDSGQSLEEVTQDLQRWVGHSRSTRLALRNATHFEAPTVSALASDQAAALLAQVSLASGHLEKAKARYQRLQHDDPADPEYPAALGEIAMRQQNPDEARKQWQQSFNQNTLDPELCYRYALLAEDAGVSADIIKAALERAVALSPGFDDARFKLALTESRTGDNSGAVVQLHAMHVPSGSRAYGYWTALASLLIELDQRDEAKQAAQKAIKAATSEGDKQRARQLSYIAVTDLTVQFETDSDGHSHMVTTRVPHGTTDWNPFIEVSDKMRKTEGKIAEVRCAANHLTGFVLYTATGALILDVPDPLHVLIRNGPAEFNCGPASGGAVSADYAVIDNPANRKNILRGMTFNRAAR